MMVEEIKELVGSILGAHRVALTDRLVEDLEAESMDVVTIVAAIEERYEVNLDQGQIKNITTVGDLVAATERAHGEPAP